MDDLTYSRKVYSLIENHIDLIILSIVDEIRKLPEEYKLSAEDSNLRDPWECYCYYSQTGIDFYVSLYEDILMGICEKKFKEMSQFEISLIYLQVIYNKDEIDDDDINWDLSSSKFFKSEIMDYLIQKIEDFAQSEELPLE